MYGYYTTTGTTVGALTSGTLLYPEDKLNNIIQRMVGGTTYKYIIDNTNDADTFLSLHNHNNNYDGLNLGDTILINDGTYNVIWKIAGFDCEYSRTASDGTTYDNGYGICLIPKTDLGVNMSWNTSATLTGAYKSSTMHTSKLVTVANNLKNVLGSHLISRNVLLSSSIDSNYHSNAYTWTTSYCTLMSVGQLTGTFAQHTNQYDDGEANYKLPLFNYEEYKTGSSYWLRGVWGYYDPDAYSCRAWHVDSKGSIARTTIYGGNHSVRPLIYLR